MKPSGRQIWFITGCDKGLGHAIAEAALQRGETVVATVLAANGRSPLSTQYANNFRCHHLDVTDHVTARELIAATEKEFGGIDVLVNNAGFGLVGAAEETEPAEYRRMFEVNFFGMVELTRAVLPGMRARRSGHIINLSSLVGFVGASGFAFYSASKFALEGFSESLAKEVEPLGIKVTIVEPGGFRTDFAGAGEEDHRRLQPDQREFAHLSHGARWPTAREPRTLRGGVVYRRVIARPALASVAWRGCLGADQQEGGVRDAGIRALESALHVHGIRRLSSDPGVAEQGRRQRPGSHGDSHPKVKAWLANWPRWHMHFIQTGWFSRSARLRFSPREEVLSAAPTFAFPRPLSRSPALVLRQRARRVARRPWRGRP
jgi:NAD(P)-dependent dehydrogenase (short-subunit alcohol dehydrogenase family)